MLGKKSILAEKGKYKGKIDERKPYLTDNYYEDFISDSSLEMKYSQRGGFETEYAEFDSDNKTSKQSEFGIRRNLRAQVKPILCLL